MVVCWRAFCEQWRHCYLLLAGLFWLVWRVSALPIPKLEETRILGGLHPVHVLILLRLLDVAWVLPLVALVLYAASFAIPRLNTNSTVAVCALGSSVLLGFALAWALVCVGL